MRRTNSPLSGIPGESTATVTLGKISPSASGATNGTPAASSSARRRRERAARAFVGSVDLRDARLQHGDACAAAAPETDDENALVAVEAYAGDRNVHARTTMTKPIIPKNKDASQNDDVTRVSGQPPNSK